MRTMATLLVLGSVFAGVGCNILQPYFYETKHYQFGTAEGRDFDFSVARAVSHLKVVLAGQGIGIDDVQQTEESAQISATKMGKKYLIDIESNGDGCHVHVEINQAGNYGEVKAILTNLQMFP